jgi:hypothetical protein
MLKHLNLTSRERCLLAFIAAQLMLLAAREVPASWPLAVAAVLVGYGVIMFCRSSPLQRVKTKKEQVRLQFLVTLQTLFFCFSAAQRHGWTWCLAIAVPLFCYAAVMLWKHRNDETAIQELQYGAVDRVFRWVGPFALLACACACGFAIARQGTRTAWIAGVVGGLIAVAYAWRFGSRTTRQSVA